MLIKGILEVAQDYNTFLIDLYGVMHNGVSHYEEALTAINYLKDQGKLVIFFSNSPRPKLVVQKKLLEMSNKFAGFAVVTSGEFFSDVLQHPDRYGFEFLKGRGLVLNNESVHPLLTAPNLNPTNSLDNADYLLIMAYIEDQNELDKFDVVMKEAIRRNLPAVCPNPDLIAQQGSSIIYTAGSFALRYKQYEGKVYYFGKPESSFYRFAIESHDIEHGNNGKGMRYILGIGDNIHTDIGGANDFGIDALLVSGGIHQGDDIEVLLKAIGLKPKYTIDSLRL